MSIRAPSRPFDPTGMAVNNLIIGATLRIDISENPTEVLSHGPFYTKNFTATANGRLLTRDVDYQFLLIHKQATIDTGKEVACVFRLLKKDISTVKCTYQVVGGKYQDMFEVLEGLAEEIKLRPGQPIAWENISNKPETFNPSAHRHHVDEMGNHRFLANPMDQIRNALEHIQLRDLEFLYGVIQNALDTYRTQLDIKLNDIREKMLAARNIAVFPVNSLLLSTVERTSATLPDGSWVQYAKDTLLYGVASSTNLGKEWGVSDKLVLPLPTDLLLNESDNPVKTVTGDYIYLDNGYTPDPGGVGDINYEGSISRIFNSRAVAVYRKTGDGTFTSLTLSKTLNGTVLQEDERVAFKIETVGYPAGTAFNYELSGVAAENVDVSLTGKMVTNATATATLSVKLVAGSPRTDESSMKLTVYEGPTAHTSTCPYRLNSNEDVTANIRLVEYPHGPQITELTRGDTLWLEVRTLGMSNKNVQLGVTGLGATENWVVDGKTLTAATKAALRITANQLYIPIAVHQEAISTLANIEFTLTDGTYVTKTPIKLDGFKITTVDVFSLESKQVISEARRRTPYQLRAETNSRQISTMSFDISVNPSNINPQPDWLKLLSRKGSLMESAVYRFDEVLSTATSITYRVLSPYDKQGLTKTVVLKLVPEPKGA